MEVSYYQRLQREQFLFTLSLGQISSKKISFIKISSETIITHIYAYNSFKKYPCLSKRYSARIKEGRHHACSRSFFKAFGAAQKYQVRAYLLLSLTSSSFDDRYCSGLWSRMNGMDYFMRNMPKIPIGKGKQKYEKMLHAVFSWLVVFT